MPRTLRPALAAVFCILAAACSSHTSSPDAPKLADDTAVTVGQGRIVGTRDQTTGARVWYGVPYAAPPVGDLRWRAPRPAEPWSGTYSANRKYAACLQYNDPKILPGGKGELLGSEDCLYLTVWVPGGKRSGPAPVMVWIHGGGNTTGYAAQYDFGRLAERQGVVVVALNYRLGPMGWFANRAIRDSAKAELDASMNFALLDILQGLDWVHDNISAFDGDADRVTLFGESAGGFNVAALMMSPLAKGRFRQAIIQSAGFNAYPLAEAEFGVDDPATRRGTSAAEAINRLKTDDLLPVDIGLSEPALASRLRALPADRIFEAYREEGAGSATSGPVNPVDNSADGIVIPTDFSEPSDRARFTVSDIPLIIGTNRDEALVAGFDNRIFSRKAFGLFPAPRDEAAYAAYGGYASRLWRILGVQRPARIRSEALSAPVYTYRFDWDEQGSTYFTDISKMVGAVHGLEVSFLTGAFTFPYLNDKFFFKKATLETRTRLSDSMMSYWARFARTGDPGNGGNPGAPTWRAYAGTEVPHGTLVFDTASGGGIRMMTIDEGLDALLDEFEQDTRFQNAEQKCAGAKLLTEIAKPQGVSLGPFRKLENTYCK